MFAVLNIASSLLRIVTLLLAAKWLEPSTFSPWILVQAIASYHVVVSFGIVPALRRQLPLLLGASKIHRFNYLLNSSVRFQIYVSLIIIFLSCGLIFLSPSVTFIGYGAILAVARNFNSLITGVQLSTLKYGKVSSGLFAQIALLLIGVIALWNYPSFGLLFWVFLIAQIFQFTASGGYSILSTSFKSPSRFLLLANRHLLSIGMPLCVGAFAGALLMTGDRWVAETIFSKSVFDQYSLPAIVAGGLAILRVTVGQALFPKVAIARGSVTSILSIKIEFLKMSLAMFSVMLMYVGFVVTILPFLIKGYLPQYTDGLDGTVWIALAGLPLSFGVVAFNFLRLLKSLWWSAIIQLFGVLVAGAIEFSFALHNPTVLSLCRGFFVGLCAYTIILLLGATMRGFREHDASPI
jgi:O-antigen/teichoic acid export membrane protein